MIRVLTALPRSMFRELLCRHIVRTPGFALAGNATRLGDLIPLVTLMEAHVVICLLQDADQFPVAYRRLFDRYPEMVLVGLLPEMDRVMIYHREIRRCRSLPSIGVERLVSEIEKACRGSAPDGMLASRPRRPSRLAQFSLN